MKERNPAYRFIIYIIGIILFGTFGYYFLYKGEVSIEDCLYMSVISITTVGYKEVLDLEKAAGAKEFTIFFVLFGAGVLLYAGTNLAAYFVEGHFTGLLRRKKMKKEIEKLQNHIIVCGSGDTGYCITEELVKCKEKVVVIDLDKIHLEKCSELENVYVLEGDATEDKVLKEAGIERAKGIIVALPSDKDNLFVVMSAQLLNPNIRIVSRAQDENMVMKMKKAGASSVVSPNFIGGLRLASELLRPSATYFLDKMLRAGSGNIRINEIVIKKDSKLNGKTLQDLNLPRLHNLLVLAIYEKDKDNFIYNPPHNLPLKENYVLVVMGDIEDINKIEK